MGFPMNAININYSLIRLYKELTIILAFCILTVLYRQYNRSFYHTLG